MKKKVTLLSAAITAALAAPAFAGINDIFISEYVEGSSYNKAIELTNTGSEDYTFDTSIGLYYDGGKYINLILGQNKESVLKDVTVPAGKSIVVINGDSSEALIKAIGDNGASYVKAGTYNEVKHGAMNFNGDDSVLLAGTTEPKNNIHDIIGIAGSDWGAGTTLRRIKEAEFPKSTFTGSDWLPEAEDTFYGLGNPELADKPVDPIKVTIGEIQGEEFRSPLLDDGTYQTKDMYQVTGYVTAIATHLVKGFYIYDSDNNPKTSDGLFVKTNDELDDSLVGKTVTVTGFVKEDYGMTTLVALSSRDATEEEKANIEEYTSIEALKRLESDKDSNSKDSFRATLERYEGMKVVLPADIDDVTDGTQDMRVTRTFSTDFDTTDKRSNMVLAYERPNMQPNQDHVPGSAESKQQYWENNDRRLYIDSDKKPGTGDIPYYPNFKADPHKNYIRINDSVVGLEGVIHYSYNNFRLIPTNTVDDSNFIHNSPRHSSPQLDDSTSEEQFAIRVATQNVLNFFNSPFGGDENTHGADRGADSQFEYERQKTKIVEAIYGLDADVIGLMEIENNGFGNFSAIKELVDSVNEKFSYERYKDRHNRKSIHNQYAFVGIDSDGNTVIDSNDSIGGDVITTGLLYRPSKVTLEYAKVIPMPSQKAPVVTDDMGAAIIDSKKGEVRENGKNYQRDTLAATFMVNNTGKKLTVSVNHLKSKGSTCWEDWKGWKNWKDFDPTKDDVKNPDYQGNCENFRVAAADHLGQEMAKLGGDQVIMGDMNSYANEDPMLVLTKIPKGKTITAAGYTFIGKKPQFGPEGAKIDRFYDFINAFDAKKENDAAKEEAAKQNATKEEAKEPVKPELIWSYSYDDEIGSLDHILVTQSLKSKVVDVTDWHINSAESTLYSYSSKYKPSGNPFYAPNAYRSSDHDSAIMALSYGYGETDGERVLLTMTSGRMDVAYAIPTDKAQEGDIAEISFSPTPEDVSKVALPKIKLNKDGKQTVFFDVSGMEAGEYTMTMKLVRPAATKSSTSGTDVEGSTVNIPVTITKRDSLTPKFTVQPYDGSGGSFGIFGLLSMLGLGFLRRSKK
ncbi:ExeM/NucH family extracellular endonuclease [Photobacterium sp. J15]|uniref:ExeM/NucH family extracellular endonuclease n=1 Tax=Photobacterium sp. J15 TaxID=265901 RepID=UPI0007E2F054|nr:ExeM/NucH family extracellular endonuclease [Photobacterium sp. J15]